LRAIGAVGEGLAELSLAGATGAKLDFGGDAANVCVMAARMGAPTRLAGRVGRDGLGDRLMAFLAARGVDVGWLRRDTAAATGLYVNEPDQRGHRFTYLRTGSAGSRLSPADIDRSFFDGLGALVYTGVTLAVSRSAAHAVVDAEAEARRRGALVACVLNHRPALRGDAAELARHARSADVVIASVEDARGVFGAGDLSSLRAALGDGPDEIVLTAGDHPAAASWPEGVALQPVPHVDARATAGAGDAFAGAYLAARLAGEVPSGALAIGVAASSLSAGRPGCASSYPTHDEVVERAARLTAPAVDPQHA
jgi:2-dehydro-3-deoxygluconokinase